MYKFDRSLSVLGLQFFADPPTTPPAEPPATPPATPPAEPPAGKTYTQEQLSAMMANEKRTARTAILKELGFDVKDDANFKATMAEIKKSLDAGKTQQQLDAEAKIAAEQAKAEAETKAAQLELKLAVLSAGVDPAYVDDVTVLVHTYMSENKPVNKALEELKTKYPNFFGSESSGSGTGGANNPPRKPPQEAGGFGKRLAQTAKPTTKSSYFHNN